jgi:hypothetical protein
MILYSNKQRELLEQVARELPTAARAEFYQLIESQLEHDTAPTDTQVLALRVSRSIVSALIRSPASHPFLIRSQQNASHCF